MSDGNTAVPVSPITEDEMSKVHDILRRAADSIVGMSQLKEDVDNLRKQVAQMSDELERLRKANAGLEESLYQSRETRTRLQSELDTVTQAKFTAERERADWQAQCNEATAGWSKARDEIIAIRHERDDAQLRAMELEDALKSANATLDKIRELFPAVVPTPPPPSGEVVLTPPTPQPIAEVPLQATRHYVGSSWEPGAIWDDQRQEYYTEH